MRKTSFRLILIDVNCAFNLLFNSAFIISSDSSCVQINRHFSFSNYFLLFLAWTFAFAFEAKSKLWFYILSSRSFALGVQDPNVSEGLLLARTIGEISFWDADSLLLSIEWSLELSSLSFSLSARDLLEWDLLDEQTFSKCSFVSSALFILSLK